ncbi:klarsicht protein isoform X2 [Musca domestica]|uniref:Klarsicht protein isoform X2 n=1 Tax=Musca domestica TaxID=7370 RepID=A0ABM3VP39_MUSDO|nr:klarsicht protein isoform X2 [Musca domestica]
MDGQMDDIPANENNEQSNVHLTSSENMENCNLTTPTPTKTIPSSTSAPSLIAVAAMASNDTSNQETDLLAAMMSEETNEGMQENSATAAVAIALSSASTYFNATTTTTTTAPLPIAASNSANDADDDDNKDEQDTASNLATAADPSAGIASSLVSSVTSATSSSSASASASASHTSNQFVTPQKPNENKSILLAAASASLPQHQKKKKRNKSSKCLDGGHNMHGRGHDSSSSLSNIKTSLSMTSLPPDEQQENRDGINAKLKVERPYNSLKKNTDRNLTNQLGQMQRASKNYGGGGGNSGSSNNNHNRYSWGSGHSSSSLHSSAATLGIGSGKDDLWAAIQTNYNYIMDTNLLDSCKEARCEIEGATSGLNNTTETCLKMLEESIPSVGSCEDPKELRKWLRDMEHKLESAPSLSEATMLSCAELQKHLTEHSVLYHEIVSHARIVSACIRAASEKEQQQQQQQLHLQQQQQQHQDSDTSLIAEQTNSSLSSTDDTATTSSGIVCCSTESNKIPPPSSPTGTNLANTNHHNCSSNTAAAGSSHSRKSEVSLERLQNRYHLLYLKAFEVQLWLDGLLRKKSSSVDNLTNEDLDSEDIDDSIDDSTSDDNLDDHNAVDGATEDDLNDLASDLESDIRHNSLSYNEDLQQQLQQQQLHSDNCNSDISHQHHRIHQRCSSNTSDIDIDEEKPTLNIVSSHHHPSQQQLQRNHHQVHLLQKASRDCIQTKLQKSAEVSSDDEGWLYTASTQQHQPRSVDVVDIESLNSDHISRGISAVSSELYSYDHLAITSAHPSPQPPGSIQSSTVSSSTSTAVVAATVAASLGCAIYGDADSDKENKEAVATTTTATTLHLQSATATTTVQDTDVIVNATAEPNNSTVKESSSSSSASSSSITSSSCSSNDMLTEATTTTTTGVSIKTSATKIRPKYHQRQEMELQINNNNNHGNGSGHHQYNNNKSAKSPTSTMQHTISSSNNNNCVSTNSRHKANINTTIGLVPTTASSSSPTTQPHNRNSSFSDDAVNGNLEKENIRFYTRAEISNINVKANDNHQYHHQHNQGQFNSPTTASAQQQLLYGQQLHGVNVGKRLPPRSPAKSSISQTSTNTSTSTISPTKGKVSHESIKQLVLEAEHLVRDEALKTPTKQKHSINCGGLVQISSTIKKREVSIMPGPIKRVQEWLEHQPTTPVQLKSPQDHQLMISPSSVAASPSRTDDCEASGEASETDSIPQHCSDDTSEGFTESIATCMQTSTNSYGNSTERMGGSAEPMVVPGSNQSLNVKVTKRQQSRRKSERPWSVSCLSQLTTDAKQVAAKVCTISNVQSGLASHSISESALDSLSPGRPRTSSTAAQVKSYDSKGSLKRRKTRKKKLSYTANGKKSDTNSEDNLEQTELNKYSNSNANNNNMILSSCESMTPQQMAEITQALLQLQNSSSNSNGNIASNSEQLINNCPPGATNVAASNAESGEEENHLMKPNFRVGSFTTAYMTNEARLGSLAKLATYMNDEELQGEYTTGTEDHHSSFSETAWDNYQEKYNSENYSEGFDSDAARKLLEFGDDYRNFIDSQSDCCSSLSAANNLDSLSPPRMDSLQQNETKIVITQDTIVSSVDHARRRRALELEYERRRKNLEIRRKSCQESLDYPNPKSPTIAALSSSTQALTPKNSERFNFQQHKLDSATRKLEFGMSHSAQSLRRTSESDTSQRRRKADERRRSSRNLEKCIKLIPATSSSSGDDSDDEKEIRNLLHQSQNRLDDTKALKIRCHLLRPEDYTEIINTCRDNIRCLESVLKGPSSSVLSSQCVTHSKDLLAAWEDLLGWSENAAAARKMQEDMIVLKHALNRLGNKSSYEQLDTEPSIQIAIEALKNEKTQLQTYRTHMLKLNASVHSWLTKQERRLQNAVVEQQLKEAAANLGSIELLEEKDEIESEHKQKIGGITASSSTVTEQTEPDSTTTATTATKSTIAVTTNKTTMITVTDSNGNQVETHTTASGMMASSSSVGTCTTTQTIANEKNWDLQSLITSENEFHKHLKDEVSDMYTAWDEADSRINSQLEVLTSSLTAWRQLECGLSEFQLALGQDRGTLQGLEGALKTGQATPGELAQNVKLVAKLLSEKVNVSQEQLTAVQDYLDPNHVLYIAKFTASNGSLSDSGISDGGATSDGGLSERERRLGVLRRLAKQLESALAPGSEAMKSIAARMESAENDLKSLQNTCRDLIVRTAASHQCKKQQAQDHVTAEKKDQTDSTTAQQLKHANGCLKGRHQNGNGHLNGLEGKIQVTAIGDGVMSSNSAVSRRKRKNRRSSATAPTNAVVSADMAQSNALQMTSTTPDGDDDPSDDNSNYDLDSSDDELNSKSKRGWAWRIARVAVPMQLALFTVFCAACLMQPNCCDNINNLSMSFTPQLRYVRGPPPI